jgi:hypothetical protein
MCSPKKKKKKEKIIYIKIRTRKHVSGKTNGINGIFVIGEILTTFGSLEWDIVLNESLGGHCQLGGSLRRVYGLHNVLRN